MSYCDEYAELISAALDGALSPHEQARLEAHLIQCPDCKSLYDDLGRVHQAFLDLPPVEVPDGLSARILEVVAAEAAQPKVIPLSPKRAAFHWQRWAATAAAVALVILGARTMQPGTSAPESLIVPAQDLPTPSDSVQPDLQAYSIRNNDPEPTANPEAPESSGIAEDQAQNEVQASAKRASEPQPDPRSTVLPSPVVTTAPESAPLPTHAVAPRMAVGSVAPPPAENTPQPDPGEGPDNQGTMDQPTPSTFMVQSTTPEELPPPEPTETTISNGLLTVPAGQEPISEDDEPEETLLLTPQEAMTLVAELCPVLEDATLVDTGDRLALETPLTPLDESSLQQASTQLEYLGLTPNQCYHEFWLYTFLLDDPEIGLAHSSTLNFFAVPIGGGEVLVQRQEVEGGLQDEADWDMYQAGIDSYLEATGYQEASASGEETPLPSEIPQP